MTAACRACGRTFAALGFTLDHEQTCGRPAATVHPDTAEHHAATDRSGLPQPPRHRGVTLPDGAPERWEVAGE